MKRISLFFIVFLIFFFCNAVMECRSYDSEFDGLAKNYLKILLQNPRKGYVFNKFFRLWCEKKSPLLLEKALIKLINKGANSTVSALYLLAFTYEREEDYEKALKIYDILTSGVNEKGKRFFIGTDKKKRFGLNILKRFPSQPKAMFYKASLEVLTHRYERALVDLRILNSLKLTGELKINAMKLLGTVYLKTGECDKAIKIWEKLARIASYDDEIKNDILELEIKAGIYDAAIRSCKKFIKEVSEDKRKKVELQIKLAEIYLLKGDSSHALKLYEYLLQSASSSSWFEKKILTKIETIYRQRGDVKSIDGFYKSLISGSPGRSDYVKKYALFLIKDGRYDEAEIYLKKLIKRDPLDRDTKLLYIRILMSQRRFKKALVMIDSLLKIYPNDSELLLKKASALYAIGERGQIPDILNKYTNLPDAGISNFITAGKLLVSYGLKTDAEELYNRMVRIFKNNADAREIRALFFYEIGKRKKGFNELKKLAEEANLADLIRIQQTLMYRKDFKGAYLLLKLRENDFIRSYKYNESLYKIYKIMQNKRIAFPETDIGFTPASKLAFRMVASARNIRQLTNAIGIYTEILKNENKINKFIREYSNKKQLPVNEACLLSELYFDKGEVLKAKNILRNQLKKYTWNPILLGRLLRILKLQYHWDEAIALLQNAYKHFSSVSQKLMCVKELVNLSRKSGDINKALHWIKEWKKLTDTSVEPWLIESGILQFGNLEQAIALLKRARYKFPDNESLAERLAQCYILHNDTEKAEKIYKSLIYKTENMRKKMRFVHELIEISILGHTENRLIKWFKDQIVPGSTNIFPYLALAEIYRKKGNTEMEKKFLSRASLLKRKDISLFLKLAAVEENQGNYDNALKMLKEAEKIDHSTRVSRDIAKFYFRHGENEKGIRKLTEICKRPDIDVAEVNDMAASLIKAGFYEKANELIKTFLSANNMTDLSVYNKISIQENSKLFSVPSKQNQFFILRFLYLITIEELGQNEKALKGFLSLLNDMYLCKIRHNTSSAKVTNPYFKSLYEAGFPKEAIEILRFRYMLPAILSYKGFKSSIPSFYQQPSYTLFFGRGNSTAFIPSDISDLYTYILGHIAFIIQNHSGREKEKIFKYLKDRNIKYADIKTSLAYRKKVTPDFWYAFHQKYPHDDMISAAWGISILLSPVKNKKAVYEAYDILKNKYPRIAVNVLLNALENIGKKLEFKRLESLVRLFNKLPRSNPSVFLFRICRYMLKYSMNKKNTDIILDSILDIYYKKMPDNPKIPSYFTLMSVLLVKSDRYKDFVDVLYHESRENTDRRASGFPYITPTSFRLSFRLPEFPPVTTSIAPLTCFFPKNIITVFSIIYGKANTCFYDFPIEDISVDINEFWKAAKKLPPCSIKLFCANFCSKINAAEKIAENMELNPKASAQDIFAAAMFEAKTGNYAKAALYFQRIINLITDRFISKYVNSLIIASAVKDPKNKQLKKMAKAALSRLIILRLTKEEKKLLLSILTDKEFFSMRNTIEKILTEAQPVSISNPPGGKLYHPDRNFFRHIEDLCKQNRLDKAASELAVKLRASLRAIQNRTFSSSPGYLLNLRPFLQGGGFSETGRIVRLIKKYHLTDKVLKKIRNPSAVPVSRKKNTRTYSILKVKIESIKPNLSVAYDLDYAAACEALGKKQEAIAVYKKILTADKKNHFAQYKLGILMAESGNPDAVKYLSDFIKSDKRPMVNFLISLTYRIRNYKCKLNVINLIINALQKDNSLVSSEILSLMYNLECPVFAYINPNKQVKIPPLFNTIGVKKHLHKDKSLLALLEKRKTVYVRLCRLSMKNPQLAEAGFSRYIKMNEIENRISDKDFTLALELIKKISEYIRNKGNPYPNNSFPLYKDSKPIHLTSIPEFIISYGLSRGKESEIHKLIKDIGKDSIYGRFLQYSLILYACNAQDFDKTANELIVKFMKYARKEVHWGSGQSIFIFNNFINTIMSLNELKNLSLKKTFPIIGLYELWNVNSEYVFMLTSFFRWVRIVSKYPDSSEFFFNNFMKIFFPELAKSNQSVAKNKHLEQETLKLRKNHPDKAEERKIHLLEAVKKIIGKENPNILKLYKDYMNLK